MAGQCSREKKKVEEFGEQALGMQSFRAYAFMKGKSPVIHMGHSVGTFFNIGGMAGDIQGKVLMFVGDRTMTRDPTPVMFPSKKKA